MIDDSKPIFQQIAERIESDVLDGVLQEEGQVPSTNEIAAFYRINPATAAKGVNLLVDEGLLYKRRGIGMFVASGARASVLAKRREQFYRHYVQPLQLEAAKLGIDKEELTTLIQRSAADYEGTPAP
ncbi:MULTISPECIES: GntR family transcriptional regulator [Arthrobacter]|uniref:GntR family transcriptional regulator n=1 Tax=Arthrobacter caoxuetaonis TaxID=2886935 RepID=A0A9X1SB22_9MICC|nr:GntR family transcriptional regulator [Arthrobacter caoxuetaonis]MCC3281020.1 GntR family transcriptional regulator [Arthrobacter caoxuetaonis]MCC3296728.1 GntR family transcriptional regulator [Arthrobacter caoxuetaonis]MCC9192818.1 GntR family transcriptional regulator [Arthrobacter sp. zg-Y916]USQ56451.1 GntR family transcriptional regulator [Arthrobacter caoxuetaonis]